MPDFLNQATIRLVLLLAALALGGIFYLAGGRRKKRLVTRPVVRFTYFCYGFAAVCALLLWLLGGIVAENWRDIQESGALVWVCAVYTLGFLVIALFVLLGKIRTYPRLSFSESGVEMQDALADSFKKKRFWRWSEVRRLDRAGDVFTLYDSGGNKIVSGGMSWQNAEECVQFAERKIVETWG